MILEAEEKREKEKHWFVVPLTYVFIGWFLYVRSPWLEFKPIILVQHDDCNWLSYLARDLQFLNFLSEG